jgi:hypothetical protein
MSPQFVDFDADGRLDIVAGIYDGSPHVAFGTAKGWKQPEQILDRNGARIVMNQFWNYDTDKWDSTTRCDPEGVSVQKGHLTSAWAADWDGDRDLDLLLGDHDSGQVMLRINEGTAAKAAFAPRNALVSAGGKPLVVVGTVTTLRLIDWNGDGARDLLVGSMGDAYETKAGGGVFVYLNSGSDGAPVFGDATVLVPASTKSTKEPMRPDAGLYMDAGDFDGDGDLDLIVGGYSVWTADELPLDDAQKARVAALQAEKATLDKASRDFYRGLDEAVRGLDEAAADAKRKELLASERDTLSARSTRRSAIIDELEPLTGGTRKKSFTWLYENLAPRRAAAEAGSRK